jgi:hypothetical protein
MENYIVNHTPVAIKITAKNNWYTRLYYLITNPFTYLFKGVVRY